ncbi:hypothetical protein JAAARDRAFT_194957 [Jaapia argillacea MUCL 33604]|uniref:DH domain-containing protein n=1 Tax=Jaapia argillacea MUCL 33604 TaxID=933084 RepID=A0A067Q131_9AGAM|nr:hypothetical protein JAAARDRAFT_194957 [Jaapia argillacea MUCL 33604]
MTEKKAKNYSGVFAADGAGVDNVPSPQDSVESYTTAQDSSPLALPPALPPIFTNNEFTTTAISSSPPTIPPRSPLRPAPRPRAASVNPPPIQHQMPLLHAKSFGTLSGLLGSITQQAQSPQIQTHLVDVLKPLPLPPDPVPDSPLPLSPVDNDSTESTESLLQTAAPIVTPAGSGTTSKRTHALLELLSSERAYASDLALIRDVHIPLALGHQTTFNNSPPSSSSSSSSSSTRTLSTSSSGSASSATLVSHPSPMTKEDAKIIFGNIAELAEFSDAFCDLLQEALGDVIEGGTGEDHVGLLFLEIIPKLEPPYKTYITRHPTALSHLTSLTSPPSPSLQTYLEKTVQLTSALTHSWDLPSLLIKPVQRLLKYPLLLSTIFEETPLDHGDKARLKEARGRMEEVARGVNEGRRRWEVVRDVLNGGKEGGGKDGKRKGEKRTSGGGGSGGLGVAASVRLGRMKSFTKKVSSLGLPSNEEAHEEAALVARLEKRLRETDIFIHTFAKQAKEWGASVKALHFQLLVWSVGFGKVIGVVGPDGFEGEGESASEAFDAFLSVIRRSVLVLCDELEAAIEKRLLIALSRLVSSMKAPYRLLEAMHTLEPLHSTLLHHSFTPSSRPPPALLEASQSYVALRGQLAVELPVYLESLERGVKGVVRVFGSWQGGFWEGVRGRWGELWDALKMDGEELDGGPGPGGAPGEVAGGAEETIRRWWDRWREVGAEVDGLEIVTPLPRERDKEKDRERDRDRDGRSAMREREKEKLRANGSVANVLASLDPTPLSLSHPPTPTPSAYRASFSDEEDLREVGEVMGDGIDRAYAHAYYAVMAGASQPHPPTQMKEERRRRPRTPGGSGNWDGGSGRAMQVEKRRSMESLQSGKSAKSGKSGRSRRSGSSAGLQYPPYTLADEVGDIMASLHPPPPTPTRNASVPVPASSGRVNGHGRRKGSVSNGSTVTLSAPQTPPQYDDDRGGGDGKGAATPSRKPSFKRRWTASTMKASESSSSSTIRPRSPSPPPVSISKSHQPPPVSSRSSSFATLKEPTPSHASSRHNGLRSAPSAAFAQSHSSTPSSTPSPRRTPTRDLEPIRPRRSLGRALYACRVVHPCEPPSNVSYHSLPFFPLRPGAKFDVLTEAGHPSSHQDLPLYVDDGEDCLLLVRDHNGQIGWALASFLMPVD